MALPKSAETKKVKIDIKKEFNDNFTQNIEEEKIPSIKNGTIILQFFQEMHY